MVTVVAPDTVAPLVPGWVMAAVSGGAFVTFTMRVAVLVRLALSRTVNVNVWFPLLTVVVFQANVVLADATVCEEIVTPSRLST